MFIWIILVDPLKLKDRNELSYIGLNLILLSCSVLLLVSYSYIRVFSAAANRVKRLIFPEKLSI